jgi:ATP-dependent Clp protease ATP-binding subunit ClpX
MRAIEELYRDREALSDYRVMIIMNASTIATEEGVVDTARLLARVEDRARQVLGEGATAEEIGRAMERATVCLDEIDKVSAKIGGKPYVTGINIQQALLTLIEGERIGWPITVNPLSPALSPTGERERVQGVGDATARRVDSGAPAYESHRVRITVDTGKMLFLCAGAFETLYDQVFQRVVSPKSGIKLPTTTTYENGKIQIREYFTLRHHFRQEDLFEYGMQPQFMSRFDNAVILEDLTPAVLARIFRDLPDGVFRMSQSFFKNHGIELEVTDQAVHKIAEEASRHSRIGARALKSIYGRIIKPFEFDPFAHEAVRQNGGGHRLVIDEALVADALQAPV